ncbi:hypothetical protein VSR34_33055 [Paraburkholderia sp. JHI2823]|uniref:hypothetical protein n=1 Tax=Paraburkholderia sp. JHI2823 TaxID=3112960 RepID=UPI00317FA1F5
MAFFPPRFAEDSERVDNLAVGNHPVDQYHELRSVTHSRSGFDVVIPYIMTTLAASMNLNKIIFYLHV